MPLKTKNQKLETGNKVGRRGRLPYQKLETGNSKLGTGNKDGGRDARPTNFFKKGVAGKIWYGNIVWLHNGAGRISGSGRGRAGRPGVAVLIGHCNACEKSRKPSRVPGEIN